MIKKMSSRKLLVLVLATVGMLMHLITEQTWLYVAIMYIGSQAFVDGLKHFNKSSIGGELPNDDDEKSNLGGELPPDDDEE